jgi:hypothetical protein
VTVIQVNDAKITLPMNDIQTDPSRLAENYDTVGLSGHNFDSNINKRMDRIDSGDDIDRFVDLFNKYVKPPSVYQNKTDSDVKSDAETKKKRKKKGDFNRRNRGITLTIHGLVYR